MSEAVLVRRREDVRFVRDVRARHVFAFVDGCSSVYDVLTSTGLPIEDASAGLLALFAEDCVAFADSMSASA